MMDGFIPMNMKISSEGYNIIAVFLITNMIVAVLNGLLALCMLPLTIFVISFFRDPRRIVFNEENYLLSPADGTITEIQESMEPDFFMGQAIKIGIFLSIFDVHFNRAPVSSVVRLIKYLPGKFHAAYDPMASAKNEQNIICFRESFRNFQYLVKQIAGVLARRIVCYTQVDEFVKQGGKIGFIKFGSKTELFLPKNENFILFIKKGDKVKSGLTVIGEYVSS